MAGVVAAQHTQPRPIAGGPLRVDAAAASFPQSVQSFRSGNLTLDTFSPVNQNGSFEFDRVIKAGEVLKRTRKTKSWKPIYIVLRPNLLSIYRDRSETKLRHQITLSDLTAVARQKDPKGKAKHVFGLFSPSRNYHLEARDHEQAQDWVELIRREARIDENEEEMTLASPGGAKSVFHGFERHAGRNQRVDHAGYSSSEAEPFTHSVPTKKVHTSGSHAYNSARRPSHTLDYSGPDQASYSDFSDSAGPAARMSALSLSQAEQPWSRNVGNAQHQQAHAIYGASPRSPSGQINPSQMSNLNIVTDQKQANTQDDERVVSQAWIYLLKSTSGMRQWKKLWMVLRVKSLALYKNEEEYSAVLVLPFSSVIDAVEVDPISRSKRFCLQIISEEKNYRMCASDEDSLDKWLGAFKSLLMKRKEQQLQKVSQAKEG